MRGVLAGPFLRLYVLTLFYFSANSILNVIIPLQGESLGASNAAIGLIMGSYLFTTMFFRPWAGRWIQKHGAEKVLRAILIVNGAALILYTVSGLEGYFVARVMQGVCTAFFSMALQLGMIDALPEQDRSQGISMYSLCTYLPSIFGPLLALGMWESGNAYAFPAVMIAIAVGTGAAGFSAGMDPASAKAASGPDPASAEVSASSGETRNLPSLPIGEWLKHPAWLRCCVLMLTASVVFGAATTFVPLYAVQVEIGNAGVYLMIQAGVVVLSRFALRKKIPSDGRWHSLFVMSLMAILTVAALCVSYSATGGAAFFYAGAALMGLAQALLYPTLMTYLTFVLPSSSRNVMIGLFIAAADLGVSMGSALMGPIADLSSYSRMYSICALLGAAMIALAYRRRGS